MGLATETGDFHCFKRFGQRMSYLVRVASENRTGESRRQGQITKTGSRHASRLLVQAACRCRKIRAHGVVLRRGQAGRSAPIIELSWKAQRRLHNLWQRLDTQRAKRRTIVAVARELSGFCLAVASSGWPCYLTASAAQAAGALAFAREHPRSDYEQPSQHGVTFVPGRRALTTKTGPADTVATPCPRA
ncbi:MAG: transposase [Solirubrobacteraceae bacterium]